MEQPGMFFGEMALRDSSPRPTRGIADEDNAELEVLDRESLLKGIKEHPQFALHVMNELCRRVPLGNTLYPEVIRGAMAPFCGRNCLWRDYGRLCKAGDVAIWAAAL